MRRVHLANGTVATNDYASLWICVWWIGRVERSTHVSKRGFLEIFSVQRETPRESDTASRREEACLLNLCYVVAQLVTSHLVAVDMTRTCFSGTDVLGPSRIREKNNSHPCAQRTFHPFCVVSHCCSICRAV